MGGGSSKEKIKKSSGSDHTPSRTASVDKIKDDGAKEHVLYKESSQSFGERSKSRIVINNTDDSETIESQVKDELTPAENAANLLTAMLERGQQTLSLKDRATLNFTLNVLKLETGAESAAPAVLAYDQFSTTKNQVDAEVHDWLRMNFTEHSSKTRSTLSARGRLRRVGLGVIAAENLMSTTSTSSTFNRLPFEAPAQKEEQILAALENVDSWNFDIFKLDDVSEGRTLECLAWHILTMWGLPQKFKVRPSTLQHWLSTVSGHYQKTEYHNSTHAADVCQTVHFFLKSAGADKFFSDIEVFALLLAAIVHDLGHDGMNNAFHKNAVTDRALTFNDQSIQENFHTSSIFTQMKQNEELNIFETFAPAQYVEIRRLMISVILCTDMTKHFAKLKDFKNLIEKKGSNPADWSDQTELFSQMLLHLADISNPAKPSHISTQWTERVLQEFFRQGDEEKKLDLPVSPQCDRDKTSKPASQIGFIKFIVAPSYETLGMLLPEVIKTCVPHVEANLNYWTKEAEKCDLAKSSSFGPKQKLPIYQAPRSSSPDARTVPVAPSNRAVSPTARTPNGAPKQNGEGKSGQPETNSTNNAAPTNGEKKPVAEEDPKPSAPTAEVK